MGVGSIIEVASSVVQVMPVKLTRASSDVKYVVVKVEPLRLTRGIPSQSVYVSYTVTFCVQDNVSKTGIKPASERIESPAADM